MMCMCEKFHDADGLITNNILLINLWGLLKRKLTILYLFFLKKEIDIWKENKL
jgi:hypothetical protein